MRCRSCGAAVRSFLDLGSTPLANSFLTEEQLEMDEPRFPLEAGFCERCTLVQLMHTVPPEAIFRDYVYVTSTSSSITAHFHALARAAVERFGLGSGDLVVELGSNDGTLLQGFEPFGVPTLGIEPAANVAAIARERGVDTLNEFFAPEVARRVRAERGPASFMAGCNVVAHIPDVNGTVAGVAALLSDDGVFQLEVPYLPELLERTEFDTIYHEHYFYFSLTALGHVLARHELRMFDVQLFPDVHGGSVRVSVCHVDAPHSETGAVAELLAQEEAAGIGDLATYERFAERVRGIRDRLQAMLASLRDDGSRVAAYGAAAKGNTLLNYCGIGPEAIEYVADKNPLKVGLYTPGTHIPVVPAARLAEDQPDYTLILAWNMAAEIVAEQDDYRRRGGRFMVPIPDPALI
jgi:hypothetical protein